MNEVELLDKTEIWVRGVRVVDADLPHLARTAATVLSLPQDKVFVTDVGDDHICLDVLIPRLVIDDFAGRQDELLRALGECPGVTIGEGAAVHSEGILGLIGAPPETVRDVLAEHRRLEEGLLDYVQKRVAVVSTGGELVDGRVHDTNFEAVRDILGAAGYEVHGGGAVPDDMGAIAGRVSRLVSEGFGLVITTGGVGAEAKDKTVEALAMVDPNLSTAILAKFKAGHGRHVKDAIRIAVAKLEYATIVALPGPTHEVRLALPVLRDGLHTLPPADLVERMAEPLRAVLPQARHHHHHS